MADTELTEIGSQTGDAELVRRAQGGDAAAFAALYGRHSAGLHDFLVRLLRDRTLADDLTQTAFLRAWEHIRGLHEPERARSWLFAIAHNLACTHLSSDRRAAPLDEIELAAPGNGPEDAALSAATAQMVWTAAASLEPRHYAVLDLSVRRGFSLDELATTLGRSRRHAAVMAHRARDAFAAALRALLAVQTAAACPRLTQLVPATVTALTAEQRRTTERHLRRCDECRMRTARLTRPAELLGGLVLLPLPPSLAGSEWMHHALRQARPPRPPSRFASARRLLSRAPVAGGVAGIAVLGGVATTVAVVLHQSSPPAPVHRVQAVVAPIPSPTATPTTAPTPPPPTPPPVDEASVSAARAFADAVDATRALSSYHVVFSTTSLSTLVSGFDLQVGPGSYMGRVRLVLAHDADVYVRWTNGVMYASGPAIVAQPDLFGLTATQASSLGNAWLRLADSGPQSDVTKVIRDAVDPYTDPTLLSEVLQPFGAIRTVDVRDVSGRQAVELADETGTLAITRYGADPIYINSPPDHANFDSYNVPVMVTAPLDSVSLP